VAIHAKIQSSQSHLALKKSTWAHGKIYELMVRVVTRTLGTLPLNRKQNVQRLRCHSILIMFTVDPLLCFGDRMGVFQTMAYIPGLTTFQKMESNQTFQMETTSFAEEHMIAIWNVMIIGHRIM